MRWSPSLSAVLLFPLLLMVQAQVGRSTPRFSTLKTGFARAILTDYYRTQTQTITSIETGVFATTSGGSLVTLPTTVTYVLTITGATNQTQSSNNTLTRSQSGSGAF
jgi:hypothetical protein